MPNLMRLGVGANPKKYPDAVAAAGGDGGAAAAAGAVTVTAVPAVAVAVYPAVFLVSNFSSCAVCISWRNAFFYRPKTSSRP